MNSFVSNHFMYYKSLCYLIVLTYFLQGFVHKNVVGKATKTTEGSPCVSDPITEPIRDELTHIHESMNFLNDQLEKMKKQSEATTLKIKELEKEKQELHNTVHDLVLRMSQIEQRTRQCNFELQCVPEHKNEDLIKIVYSLGELIGCTLDKN